jgi:hypothetical protein
MNINQMITSYWHASRGAGNVSRYDRMRYVSNALVANHYDYVVRCFPARQGEGHSAKDLWLYIEGQLK